MSDQPKTHREVIQDMIDEGVGRDEITTYLRDHSEYALDLDSIPRRHHNWVRRGIKVSCEGAGHPHHSHFLFPRKR